MQLGYTMKKRLISLLLFIIITEVCSFEEIMQFRHLTAAKIHFEKPKYIKCITRRQTVYSNAALASQKHLEKEYQRIWCKEHNGITEYTLKDKTRIDCVTENYAIEFDFAKKWAESIGQALYYSLSINKHAGIVLIIKNPQKDLKYLTRLKEVASKYNIRVWIMTPSDIEKEQ